MNISTPAKLKNCMWSPCRFRDNSCLLKQADDVLLGKHFTDLDYLDWFLRYERFCEPRYL